MRHAVAPAAVVRLACMHAVCIPLLVPRGATREGAVSG
jgi:hypothetical protein